MKTNLLFLLLIMVGLLISCQKEGCTDPSATNYDPNADSNDGSCQYGNSNPSVGEGDNCILNENLNYGSLTDQDGNTYPTILIGTQEWMAENLRTTSYANGDPIPNITDDTLWCSLTTGAWCHYNNDNQFENTYGKLYNWYTVDDSRNVCPTGWHVPSLAEIDTLSNFLGSNAGDKMRSVCDQYWYQPDFGATNESGFSGIGGGHRGTDMGLQSGLPIGSYAGMLFDGWWWIEGEAIAGIPLPDDGMRFRLSSSDDYVSYNDTDKGVGHSVRCLKD